MTLAQMMLDLKPESFCDGVPGYAPILGLVRARLLGEHVSNREDKFGVGIEAMPGDYSPDYPAESFVMEGRPTELVHSMLDGGRIERQDLFRNCGWPLDTFWIEWKSPHESNDGEPLLLGALVDKHITLDNTHTPNAISGPDTRTVVFCGGVRRPRKAARVLFASTMSKLPTNGASPALQMRWRLTDVSLESAKEQMGHCGNELVSMLFLITMPRICTVRADSPPAKMQARRKRAGERPLLEHKRVTMTIGVAPAKRAGAGGGAATGTGGRRKLHDVIWHFRTVTETAPDGTEVAKKHFVPAHWRGDPKLGIIIKHRTVKPPPDVSVLMQKEG